jgi:hypothetical protein
MDSSKPVDTAVLLDKVARLYPAGIPTKFIQVPREDVPPQALGTKVLFVVVYPTGEMPAADRDFLSSIASKGMRLQESEFTVTVVKDLPVAEARLRELSTSIQPRAAIIFAETKLSGPEPLDGLPAEAGQVHVIRGPQLSHLASNAEAKRNFWKMLQEMLNQIAEG